MSPIFDLQSIIFKKLYLQNFHSSESNMHNRQSDQFQSEATNLTDMQQTANNVC